ncbi:hypothetical protein ACP4OV_005345 [Aristida adscensionis]
MLMFGWAGVAGLELVLLAGSSSRLGSSKPPKEPASRTVG